MNATIIDALKQAVAEGKLLESSLENIELLTGGTQDPVGPAAIEQPVNGPKSTTVSIRLWPSVPVVCEAAPSARW